jgi:hypothetical protein
MKGIGPYLRPGTRVRYDGTGKPEYGIVVHCWINDEVQAYDCYVAFFGDQFPEGNTEVQAIRLAVLFDVAGRRQRLYAIV